MATYDFKGKTIVVTGAGAGIGKAITTQLVKYGAQVIAVSLLQSELDVLVQELPGIRAIQVDLRDWEGTKKALQDIGVVHGLVNNAGVASVNSFMNITESDFDLTFSVNVKALVNVSQIVVKSMLDNDIKGSIVNISSVAALTSLLYASVYCGSKGAVQQITKCMAVELGRKGIRVNSVNPTLVKTELSKPIWTSKLITDMLAERSPMGVYATTEDIANATIFLLSDQSSMINGIPVPVDGGYVVA